MPTTHTAGNQPDPAPETAPAAVLAMSAIKFRIPGDTINKAVSDLPEDQRTALKWFAGYARSRNLGPKELETLLQKDNGTYYSYATIYQALTGRRQDAGATLAPLVRSIEQFRRNVEGISKLGDTGFVETRLFALMSATMRRARVRNKVTFIFGESQIGKSENCKEHARRNNHGETVYVEAPSGGAIGPFLSEIARALGIPTQQRSAELRRRILDSFDDKMLLIIDEAHRFVMARYSERGLQSLDFIRELYNRTNAGVVIVMTNEGRDLFRSGPHAKALKQLWNRRIQPLQLPHVPPRDDLDRFAAAYGLDPAPDEPIKIRVGITDNDGEERTREFTDVPARLQKHVVTTEGLGVWLTILQDAADMAKESRRQMSWGAVLRAYTLSQAEPDWN